MAATRIRVVEAEVDPKEVAISAPDLLLDGCHRFFLCSLRSKIENPPGTLPGEPPPTAQKICHRFRDGKHYISGVDPRRLACPHIVPPPGPAPEPEPTGHEESQGIDATRHSHSQARHRRAYALTQTYCIWTRHARMPSAGPGAHHREEHRLMTPGEARSRAAVPIQHERRSCEGRHAWSLDPFTASAPTLHTANTPTLSGCQRQAHCIPVRAPRPPPTHILQHQTPLHPTQHTHASLISDRETVPKSHYCACSGTSGQPNPTDTECSLPTQPRAELHAPSQTRIRAVGKSHLSGSHVIIVDNGQLHRRDDTYARASAPAHACTYCTRHPASSSACGACHTLISRILNHL
ncbi:hypothetical protein B0H19DRAFT_1079115 [Mycena capillaripes]|nr:hypothetical protein B0H19DRAFT_1079115 [Mycena capillaripes]